MAKQLTLGVPRISAGNDPQHNWQNLSAILEAMGYPAPADKDHTALAGVSFFPGPTIDIQLTEVLKDTDGDGVYTGIAKVLGTDGTQTTTSPTTVTVCDRGGRYQNARADDKGKAQQRLISGAVCWEVVEIREDRRLFLYGATDSTGGVSLNGTAKKITFDNEVYSEGGVWSLASSSVTVNTSGALSIEADVTIDCTALSAGNPSVALYVDVGGSEQTGSRRYFPPITVTGKSSVSVAWVHDLTVGDVVSVKALVTNSGSVTATVATVADLSFLRLSRIDADVNTASVPDSDLGNVFEWETNTDTDNTGVSDTSSSAYAIAVHSGTGPPTNGGSNCGNLTSSTEGNYPGTTFMWQLDDMTVACWLKPADVSQTYLRTKNQYSSDGWKVTTDGSRFFQLTQAIFDNAGVSLGSESVTSTVAITSGTWYFVCLKWQKFTATGDRYRVGVSIDNASFEWSSAQDATATSLTGATVLSTGSEFHINNIFSRHTFQVDLYRQWFRELSAAEVTYHYNSGDGRAWPF